MTQHLCPEFDPACYRCDLRRDEVRATLAELANEAQEWGTYDGLPMAESVTTVEWDELTKEQQAQVIHDRLERLDTLDLPGDVVIPLPPGRSTSERVGD